MALIEARVALRGYYPAGQEVTFDTFVQPLALTASDPVVNTLVDRGAWASGLVVLCELALASFSDDPEPHEALAARFAAAMSAIAEWLGALPTAVFSGMRERGMRIDLLLDLWIDQGQFELSLPPSLLSVCARHGLNVELVTND